MKINGDRIKKEMKKKRITQQKIADVIGVDRTEISNWINGKRGIKAKELYKLSNYLEITVDELTNGEPITYPQMVAVVRCKDCRYGQYCTDGETTYQCFKWNSNEFGALHEQDWYCADGQR